MVAGSPSLLAARIAQRSESTIKRTCERKEAALVDQSWGVHVAYLKVILLDAIAIYNIEPNAMTIALNQYLWRV